MTDAPSFDDRLATYLRPIADAAPTVYEVLDTVEMAICGAAMNADAMMESLALQPYGRAQAAKFTPQRLRELVETYVLPISRTLIASGRDGAFLTRLGDNRDAMSRPGFVKSRLIADPGAGVLAPLNHARHFSPLAEVEAADRPYEAKDDRLVWRGATTGRFIRTEPDTGPYSARYYVHRIVAKAPVRPDWDIGYSLVTRPQHLVDAPLQAIHAATRPHLSMSQLLTSKFLLVLEGNDVSSGLKWILASRSTPIMPTPTVESWACEALLRPFVHYVPVAADLSDLAEVHAWCLDNDGACRDIALAGRAYMTAFADQDREDRLFRTIAEAYADRVMLEARDLDVGRALALAVGGGGLPVRFA